MPAVVSTDKSTRPTDAALGTGFSIVSAITTFPVSTVMSSTLPVVSTTSDCHFQNPFPTRPKTCFFCFVWASSVLSLWMKRTVSWVLEQHKWWAMCEESTCQLFCFHNGRSRTWKFKKKIPTGLAPLHATLPKIPFARPNWSQTKKGYDPFFPDFVKKCILMMRHNALSLVSLLANAAKNVVAAIQTASKLQ